MSGDLPRPILSLVLRVAGEGLRLLDLRAGRLRTSQPGLVLAWAREEISRLEDWQWY